MDIKLAQSEQIIKSWDYAIAGDALASKTKKFKHNLTVTNKRIIWSSYNDVSINRKEIPLKDVKFVEGSFARNRSFWAKVKLFIGIPLCIVIIGIFMVKDALATLRGAKFEMEIGTALEYGESISIGKTAGVAAKKGFFARFTNKKLKEFKVKVDKANASEILNELGALVLDAQG